MAHITDRLARILRTSRTRRAQDHPARRTSTPMSEALAVGLGLAPQVGGRPQRDLPQWQR